MASVEWKGVPKIALGGERHLVGELKLTPGSHVSTIYSVTAMCLASVASSVVIEFYGDEPTCPECLRRFFTS